MSEQKTTDTDAAATRFAHGVAHGIALTAGIFSIVVAILLVLNYRQTTASAPLDSPDFAQLRKELRDKPNDDALKQRIREMDLLARKAFFTSQSFARTGGFLLLGGVIVTLTALRTMLELRKKFPDPRQYQVADDAIVSAASARRAIVGMGLLLVVMVVALAALFRSDGIHPTVDAVVDRVQPRSATSATENNRTKTAAILLDKKSEQKSESPDIEMTTNWPSFRGPGGIGVALFTNSPTEWDAKANKNIIWKTALLKRGFNSPIVWGNRVLFSGADTTAREVYCFETATGQMLWKFEVKDIPGSPEKLPEVTTETGYAAPTMATDGNMRFFAIFATGDIVCLDHCGTKIWARNIGLPEIRYGYASSPIVHRNVLVVMYDSDKGGRLLGLDCATGKTLWDTPRKVDACWSSPTLVNTGKRMEIIINANPIVAGYDPMTGRELWNLDCMSGEVAPSPAYADGMAFVANEFARLAAIKLGEKPEKVWEADEGLPNVSSPLATSQYVFLASSGGTLTCYDAKQGKLLWKQECDEGYYSSPTLVGDRVYVMNMAGQMHIFKADKEYHLISKPEIGENCVTTPAFMNGRIYIRGENNLFCIGEK